MRTPQPTSVQGSAGIDPAPVCIGASRLHHISHILQVPVTFLFEGTPGQLKADGNAPSAAYVSDFLATPDGLALTRAFTRLTNAKPRRRIVDLVKEIAGDDDR